MSKEKRTYNLKSKTVESINQIEDKTGLKKSTIVDKAIEDYKTKIDNQ
jgi:hypothetical protein